MVQQFKAVRGEAVQVLHPVRFNTSGLHVGVSMHINFSLEGAITVTRWSGLQNTDRWLGCLQVESVLSEV